MADLKDILQENEEQLSEEELLKYFDDDISDEEKYALEKKMSNSPFDIDAVQGLLQIQNKKSLEKHVSQLNLSLRQLTAKKPRKPKEKIKIFEWMILVLVILLFICVVSFIIITLQNEGHLHTQIPFLSKYFPAFI